MIAPVAVALAAPAAAAGVAVTPALEGCGVVVAVTGLGEGTHTAIVQATVLDTGEPVPVVPEAGAPPAPEPQLTAVRTLSGDGEVLVTLDAAAVPDADPVVAVDVTVDGEPAARAELALPGCGATSTGEPTGEPTGEATASPTATPTATPTASPTATPSGEPSSQPTTTDPSTSPAVTDDDATATPVAESSEVPAVTSSASPSPSASPTASPTPTPTASALPTATPTTTTVTTSPLAAPSPVPSPTPSLLPTLEQAYGTVTLGTGTTGVLSLMSFAAAPQLDAATAPVQVPAPVIAAPEGSAAGVLPPPEGTGSPLSGLLPPAPEADGDEPVTAELAAPDLATDAAADPLVDLAPAAFVLSASLGGLLMAGRRRTT